MFTLLKHLLKTCTLFIFLWYPNWSWTVSVKVNKELTLRTSEQHSNNQERYGRPVGILPKGSIVDIPDQYVVRLPDSREVDLNQTLVNWLSNGMETFYQSDKELYLYYTPIKVIHPKVDTDLEGKQLYTGLQHLQMTDEFSTTMEVIEDSELRVIQKSMDETEAQHCGDLCFTEEDIDEAGQDIIELMKTIRNELVRETASQRAGRKTQVLHRLSTRLQDNLEQTCGLSQQDICSELDTHIAGSNLPFTSSEIMSLMILESAGGQCSALNYNKNSNGDILSTDFGLFQINTINLRTDLKRNNIKECSKDELQALSRQARQSSNPVDFWKSQPKPQCANNPMYNLQRAIEILNQCHREMSRYFPGSNQNSEHRDLLPRLTLSCYNGGGGNIRFAQQDLLFYNASLQNRLADHGVDITRSNRDIALLKDEADRVDQNISQIRGAIQNTQRDIRSTANAINQLTDHRDQAQQAVDQTSTDLNQTTEQLDRVPEERNEGLRKIGKASQEAIREDTKNRREQLEDLAQETEQNLSRSQQQINTQINNTTRGNINRAKQLAQQWNRLNEEEAGLITDQQSILNFLDSQLLNLTHQQTRDNLSNEDFQKLTTQKEAVERLIQEIEEEKWPYFTNQIIGAESTNIGDIVRRLNSRMSSKFDDWDLYQIHALERQLSGYEKQRAQLSRSTGVMFRARDLNQLDQKIHQARTQLLSAQKQRRQDIEQILDKKYRDPGEGPTRARALRIIEAEIARLTHFREEAEEKAHQEAVAGMGFWERTTYNMRDFFTPSAPDSEELKEFKQIRTGITTQEREQTTYLSSLFSQRREPRRYSSLLTQRSSKAAQWAKSARRLDEQRAQRYPPKTNWKTFLAQWTEYKGQLDQQRAEIEQDDFFQQLRPYFRTTRGKAYTQDIAVTPTTNQFINNQTFFQHIPLTVDAEIRQSGSATTRTALIKTGGKIYRDKKTEETTRQVIAWNEEQDQKTSNLEERKSQLSTQLQTQQDRLAALQENLENQTKQKRILLVNHTEKSDQHNILVGKREQIIADIATRKKDPYNWEDLKIFYFARQLRETFFGHYLADNGIDLNEELEGLNATEQKNKLDQLKQQWRESTGVKFRSRRSKDNAILNIAYADSLLGTEDIEGFTQTDRSKQLCSGNSSQAVSMIQP